MALNKRNRSIIENGIVIEKLIREATKEFTIDGKTIPAKSEALLAVCVSSENFSDEFGYVGGMYLEYPISREIYDKLKFGTKVECEFELTASGSNGKQKAIGITIIEELTEQTKIYDGKKKGEIVNSVVKTV